MRKFFQQKVVERWIWFVEGVERRRIRHGGTWKNWMKRFLSFSTRCLYSTSDAQILQAIWKGVKFSNLTFASAFPQISRELDSQVLHLFLFFIYFWKLLWVYQYSTNFLWDHIPSINLNNQVRAWLVCNHLARKPSISILLGLSPLWYSCKALSSSSSSVMLTEAYKSRH